jgi:hypothetical protein
MPYDANSDPWRTERPTLNSIGRRAVTVVPSDSSDLAAYGRVVLLTAGNVNVLPVDNADSDTEPFVGLPAGYVIPFLVRRVLATGTNATVAVF